MRHQGLAFVEELLDIEKHHLMTSYYKKPVRTFRLPALNFKASNYFELMKIKYEPIYGSQHHFGRVLKQPFFEVFTPNAKETGTPTWVKMTLPPLIKQMTPEEIHSVKTMPLEVTYPCHSQSVEHGVALSSKIAERFIKRDSQLQATLQVFDARKRQPEQVTHAGFKNAIKRMNKKE